MTELKENTSCQGVVVEVLGPVVFVCHMDGDRIVEEKPYACSLIKGHRFKAGKPLCGDIVTFRIHSETVQGRDYQGVIEDISERTSLVERLETNGIARTSRKNKSVVANLDTLAVVTSVGSPVLSPGIVDRYLVCASHWHLDPLIIINKWELAEEIDEIYVSIYRALGYRCELVSAHQQKGIDELRDLLTGRRSAFLGHSGVGKSSLLNCLFPNANLATGEISLQSQRGCHTTTASRLLPFENGGFIIDTPGVREFGITGISKNELSDCFPEFGQFSVQCRFQPCSHTHEPGCAVKEAVEAGNLAEFRYRSYLKMLEDIQEMENAKYV